MIPARIGISKKKILTGDLREGEYFGIWSGYVCWIKNESGEILFRFDTKTLSSVKHGRVRLIYKLPYIYIYEILKKKNT